uniref:Alpha-1,4 glucan phosphorylase n=1 Tax=uncultured Xylanimonas sp. TaxID=876087 RepID=A0A060CE46_9MICO|nr:phosphorylase [uncultured Xylanimonas sp.]
MSSGTFSHGDPMSFESFVSNLLYDDRFMALADFRAYLDAQSAVEAAYRDEEAWTRSAILNVARSGFFSSDRAMKDYLDRIWDPRP